MCGACGAGSARSALHWSAPFLASVPARAAAAGTLTRWARTTGWSGTVRGVAGGFEVATASGRRSLAADLGAVLERLAASGVRVDRLLDDPAAGVVQGPPTWPGPRPYEAGWRPIDGATETLLPPDPHRRHRVPALLGGLAVAEWTGELAPLWVHLGLGGTAGLVVTTNGRSVSCAAVPAPDGDVVASAGDVPAVLAILGCWADQPAASTPS